MKPHITRTTSRDDYCTPDELFKQIDSVYHFDFDAAATKENSKVKDAYFAEAEDGALKHSWLIGGVIWCNPPFSNKEAFLDQALRFRNENTAVIFVLPANAHETNWWSKYVRAEADEVITLTPRVNFELDGKRGPGAGFASCLVIYYPRVPGVVYGPPRESLWRWK